MRRTGTIIAGASVIAGAVTGGAAAYGELRLPGVQWQGTVVRSAQDEEKVGPRRVEPPTASRTVATTPVQRVERRVVVEQTPEPVPPSVLPAGRPLLSPGDAGPQVREIQARLRQIGWFYGDVTDSFGDQTRAAVEGFQAKRGYEVTGVVDQRTLNRLEEMTVEPTADELANVPPDPADGTPLDPRCLTGRVLCVDKSSSSLRWVVDGEVRLSLDARFGGNGYTTREGSFSVYRKSRDHVSSLYDTSMPFAMFFDGGQAVHYSPDFAANGYAGASHGCVNIRDYDEIATIYDQVQLGDRVVVYWS